MSAESNWRPKAACNDKDKPPDWWFPDYTKPNQASMFEFEAQAVCRKCPVRSDCLMFAAQVETANAVYGIYGGFTAKDRERLYRKAPRSSPVELPKAS